MKSILPPEIIYWAKIGRLLFFYVKEQCQFVFEKKNYELISEIEFDERLKNFSPEKKFELAQRLQELSKINPGNIFFYLLFRKIAYGEEILARCYEKKIEQFDIKIIDNNIQITKVFCRLTWLGLKKIFLKYKNEYLINLDLKKIKKEKLFFAPRVFETKKSLKQSEVIIITGWWGSETHGDKAILAELICFINKKCPKLKKIYITSIFEMNYVVEKTIQELAETKTVDISKIKTVIPIENFHNSQEFSECDFVIVGGGPIEKIKHLFYIERSFRKARQQYKGTFLFGCGLDPHLGKFLPLVRSLLAHTQYCFWRDKQSLAYALNIYPNAEIFLHYACCPSLNFVRKWLEQIQISEVSKKNLCLLVRKNTSEYLFNHNEELLAEQNEKFNTAMANFISNKLDSEYSKIKLLAMNDLWFGGNDLVNNKNIFNLIENREAVVDLSISHMSLNELLKNVSSCSRAIVMRYHGHLFCLALGVPFVSIDYTGKGNKIDNLLEFLGLGHLSLDWNEVSLENLTAKFCYLNQYQNEIKNILRSKYLYLLDKLEKVYEKFD